ncbi:cytochrome d ubiquinol oxidase subunit II [Paraferrimonas sp. SM1919]|uniref:cytochrome d ubiquinol oxidase subunit II n=1 Tax=Paraferrimonas sp. SM1919 TaxID=2662263 RepID=UPI0013D545EA|nr:cytochrome d ubiquinol oxidase subunit II [Paraferrimonas sp. SM1919]
MFDAHTLALIYIALLGLAVILYALLDGYDLGVGILLPINDKQSADTMIASIGPFWDANETWLVLAVGLLLIAFPEAHSIILTELYLPATFMLLGLILRGVAFDFRAKAAVSYQKTWDVAFKFGSLLAAFTQGYMLGLYVIGFDSGLHGQLFAVASGIGVSCAYAFIGGTWLIMKTEGKLQQAAIVYCKYLAAIAFIGIALVTALNLYLYPQVFAKWFAMPTALILLPLPLLATLCFIMLFVVLNALNKDSNWGQALPFVLACLIFIISFFGLGFSFFPYIVPNQLSIFDALAAPASLNFLMWGVVIVVPTILAYTIYSYRVFWGKAEKLSYY